MDRRVADQMYLHIDIHDRCQHLNENFNKNSTDDIHLSVFLPAVSFSEVTSLAIVSPLFK